MKRVHTPRGWYWILSLTTFCLTIVLAGCGVSGKTEGLPTAATVSVVAAPASIAPGASATLTVVATNATQVMLTGTDGSSFSMPTSGGTQSVTPTATTTYTATATGPAGKVTATATVTVTAPPPSAPAPTVTIKASLTSITAGSSTTLTVAATNATQVAVHGDDGSNYTLQPNGGTQSVSPAVSTTYTATAIGAGGQTTATVLVTVTPAGPAPAAPTVTIAANPASIAAGASSTLTVTATDATEVVVTETDNGQTFMLPGTGGTKVVSPTKTTTYVATASGPGGVSQPANAIVTVTQPATTTVTITASPASLAAGGSSTLTVAATNATQVTVTGSDNSSYNLPASGGTQSVSPTATTTYTATAKGAGSPVTANVTVTVTAPGSVQSVDHVIFMLQENHTFDNYFGMLNPYRHANSFNIGDDGKDYEVDGIDDKLASISNQDDQGNSYPLFKFSTTCIDDETSAWLESYGDVDRYNFSTTRPIKMDGFVHTAEGFSTRCNNGTSTCSGNFTDTAGQRAMGYYDENFLNYYYYMASQFAVSNRWFSPISSKSLPNRIATFTGGTTQGLTKDPGSNDQLPQLSIPTIFQELDAAKVSWKIYYTVTNPGTPYPDTTFSSLSYSFRYLYQNPTKAACTGTTQPSSVVGDAGNSFCIDPNHIAPLSTYFTDLTNNTLPSFGFIESGSGTNDEHPGSGQSILTGQVQVSNIVNSLMSSSSWKSSVFFLAYDEGGGPYDHVPPVPGHSNDNTSPSLGTIPDISGIAVNPDSYAPCVPATEPATTHCDLNPNEPGANPTDAAAQYGFAAQIGFRVPNIIISPFTRRHYVGNNPMDHTAILKFVENRFIGSSANLTARDAAQPNLMDFFDFTGAPWSTPPTPPPAATPQTLGHDPCHAAQMQ